MTASLPIVLVPGLLCSARLYMPQLPVLWRFGPVTIADTTRDDSIQGMARRVLATAPPRFALAGLSMGGYVAMEIMRQAPDRVAQLALIDTTARPDTNMAIAVRQERIALVKNGGFSSLTDMTYPLSVHSSRLQDAALRSTIKKMAKEVGPETFLLQQQAIMTRIDSRPSLSDIECKTVVVVGDGDQITPPECAIEMAVSIEGAKLVIIPNCGHMSTLEQPDAVAAALAEWLTQ